MSNGPIPGLSACICNWNTNFDRAQIKRLYGADRVKLEIQN